MRVTITTDGGFTGRGIGSASGEVADDELRALGLDEWRGEYAADGQGRDIVLYTMSIGTRRVRWTDGAELPDGLRALFERIWRKEKGTG